MNEQRDILGANVGALRDRVPAMDDFFLSTGLPLPEDTISPASFFRELDEEFLHDIGMKREKITTSFADYYQEMMTMGETSKFEISSLTILGGHDKSGTPEDFSLEMRPGQIICLVGPTGSGKSRLLADIEWMAGGDTPTGRKILINNEKPEPSWRHSQEHQLFAQLSQNMNFVMDVNVADFVRMHAESRLLDNIDEKVEMVLEKGNGLAGEPFSGSTLLTDLSGGQSRSLMIADIAFLSKSPVVLIDEIENAGIDRANALDLLVGEEKIVIIATHDPLLALMGEKRLIMKNGGIHGVVIPTVEERNNIEIIDHLDKTLLDLRSRIRCGERIDFEIKV